MKSEIDKVSIKLRCVLETSNLSADGKKQVLAEILSEVSKEGDAL